MSWLHILPDRLHTWVSPCPGLPINTRLPRWLFDRFHLPNPDLTSYWYLQKKLLRGQSYPWLGLTIQISTYTSLAYKTDRKRLTLRLYFLVTSKFSDLNCRDLATISVKHLLRFHADFDYLEQNVCMRFTDWEYGEVKISGIDPDT